MSYGLLKNLDYTLLLKTISLSCGAKMRTPEQDKKNQQTCNKCGRIVGCDYHGRKHKCGCNQGDK